jgi:predicted anti-sigma-YlaC factor YlaD
VTVAEHVHDCRRLLADLGDYLEDAAAQRVCAEIEHHLANCPDCRILVDTLRRTISLFRQHQADPRLPEDVMRRLVRTLDLDDLLKGHPGEI